MKFFASELEKLVPVLKGESNTQPFCCGDNMKVYQARVEILSYDAAIQVMD